jgi:phosphohistidine phosphatase
MNLYVLRHGIAVEAGTGGCRHDSERYLTTEGRQKLLQVAAALTVLEIAFDVILSSPYVRARETAELIASKTGQKKQLRLSEHLQPGGGVKALLQEMRQTKPAPESVLLVGHEPDLSRAVSFLVSGSTKARFELKKAGLIALDAGSLAPCGAVMRFMLTPRQLRLIARSGAGE